jgi:hypothetical protein
LNEFIQNFPKKDKQLLLQTISKCYLKNQDSIIKDNGNSELNIELLMALIIDQKIQFNKL